MLHMYKLCDLTYRRTNILLHLHTLFTCILETRLLEQVHLGRWVSGCFIVYKLDLTIGFNYFVYEGAQLGMIKYVAKKYSFSRSLAA